MLTPNDLSVLIPSHRRADLLQGCLASIFDRALPALHAPRSVLHVLVIDDGSPGACVSRTAERFPGVRVVRHEKARGFCAAVNSGVRAAATAFVQLLNDDAEVTPGWFEAPLAKLRAEPKVAAVTPLVMCWNGERVDSAGDEYDAGGFARKRGHGQRLTPEHLRPGLAQSVSGCGAFFRRDALLAIGGFPEEFGAYFDDVDVSLRLREAGHALWYEPACRILHHGSASYGQRPSWRTLAMQSRNEERLFWRHLPHGRRLPALARHAAVLAGKSWLRLEEGALRPFLDGRLRAWAELLAF